jgi:hypothetical protein
MSNSPVIWSPQARAPSHQPFRTLEAAWIELKPRTIGWALVEQMGQGGRAGMMRALADQHLDRLQVGPSVLPAVGQDLSGQTSYFLLRGRLLAGWFPGFFSCSDGPSGSAGRV